MDSNIPIVSAAETWKKLDLSILNKSLNQEVSYSDFFHALGYQDKDNPFLIDVVLHGSLSQMLLSFDALQSGIHLWI